MRPVAVYSTTGGGGVQLEGWKVAVGLIETAPTIQGSIPVTCPRCKRPFRKMDASEAHALYRRLSPFLEVVPSFGCYTPKRGDAEIGDHSAWPMHFWRGPGHFPLVVRWNPNGEKRPNFTQFCLVYAIQVTG